VLEGGSRRRPASGWPLLGFDGSPQPPARGGAATGFRREAVRWARNPSRYAGCVFRLVAHRTESPIPEGRVSMSGGL